MFNFSCVISAAFFDVYNFDRFRIEKISRFLEKYGPHFESHSRSFKYPMPKKKTVGL